MWRLVINATVYAIAMAYVESMIVVYLRRLYYPQGLQFPLTLNDLRELLGRINGPSNFQFPLVIIDFTTWHLEFWREAATIVMLATMGIAAGRTKAGKFAYFLLLFGVWDIFYYLWLYVFLQWPPSLLTWDVLFLIPVPWVGPVLAPVIVAVTMIGMGLVILHLESRGPVRPAGKTVWLAQVGACLIVIVSFTMDVVPHLDAQGTQLARWVPTTYRWWMLGVGEAIALGTFVRWTRQAYMAQPLASNRPLPPSAPGGQRSSASRTP